jgi:mono/diheme cytochrome c family protein
MPSGRLPAGTSETGPAKRPATFDKRKEMKRFSAILFIVFLTTALGAWAAVDVPDGVKKLAQQKCAGCHKGMFAPKGLKLDPAHIEAILDKPSQEVPTLKIVDTKAPESSYILKKIRRQPDIVGKPMPPPKALTAEELQIIETWILGLK